MSKLRKMTTAYLARFTKSHGFQRIQREIVQCSNTLLSGSTMGARLRRKEMLTMLKEVHSIIKEQAESHGDKAAFETLEAKNELQSTSVSESPEKSAKVAPKVEPKVTTEQTK
jgi:hypothetical protein